MNILEKRNTSKDASNTKESVYTVKGRMLNLTKLKQGWEKIRENAFMKSGRYHTKEENKTDT